MNTKKLFQLAFCSLFGLSTLAVDAQTNLGESCGCPAVGSRTTVNLSTLADSEGVLNASSTILTCDKVWNIDDKIYVADGKSLTIQPGTLLKGIAGVAGDANALIISKGGKIIAPGTEECQIVFTASADPMDGSYGIANKGQWGGVVILGKAKNNLVGSAGGLAIADGIGFIEGFVAANPNNQFGMAPGSEIEDDNSGIMSYVSIRHAGDIAGTDNELNGLTLGSVGRGTTLHHIEVISNLDDGIEFFGGNVDLKYASVLFNDDDGFDYDLGWSGKGQFWVVVKTDKGTAAGGDNGFECDGDDSDVALFYASPKIYNATFIGAKDVNGSTIADGDSGMEMKEGTRGELRNCILANYGTGVKLYGEGAPKHNGLGDAYQLWNAGSLIIENNTFIGATTLLAGAAGATITAADLAKFAADGNTGVASVAGITPAHTMNVNTNAVSAKHDLIPDVNITTTTNPAVDGFFSPAPYRGAFEAGKKSWLSDYSLNALIGLESNLTPCPTDINANGQTNNTDFLLLLGSFNTSCN